MSAVMKNEVNTLAIEDRPSFIPQGHAGTENVGTDDLSIPRLDVIQSLSPQRKKSDPAYIEGAEEGLLFNSVTGKLYGKEVAFVPCYFRKEYIIWKDRDSGGGFNGAFDDRAEAERKAHELGRNYEVVDTAQHFGLIVHPDMSMEQVVLSCAKSKLKMSRQLNTLARMTNADSFASLYRIEAIEVKGEKGDYFSMKVARMGWCPEAVYEAGKALYDAVRTRSVDVNREYSAGEERRPSSNGADDAEF